MKTFKFLSIALSLVAVLSACSLPGRSSSPTQITNQNPVGSVATMTLQVNPTPTGMVTIAPTYTPPTVIGSPVLKTIVPNTPTWSVYNYTCELAVGGATMTMKLAWTDRSNSEESYKVYRDKQVIATLAPNSTSYVDVAFVATGETLSYSVEAFNKDWRVSTSTITYGCQ
ncbi:MAG: hypothetical protein ABSF99_06345 [Anaerolineales bacterium]